MTRFWRNYNLSIVLFAIFLVCWVIQTIAGWVEFTAQETQHRASPEMFASTSSSSHSSRSPLT